LTAGLPDEAALNRLASAFFAALPGQTPSGADVAPFLPATPDNGLSLAGNTPAIAPAPLAGTGTESAASRGGSQLGVPEAYAASLPLAGAPSSPVDNFDTSPVFAPSTPYYFVGESSPYAAPALASERPAEENRVVAQTFGLPGEIELRRLLADIAGERGEPAARETADAYYFLETPAKNSEISPAAHPAFDIEAIRRDFPILAERVNGKPLIWFDNAATTQKPQAVIDRLAWFYAHENSNIHRAAHELAARSTDAYEAARNKVARFIGAQSANEIVFVRGATEAINLVAQSWGRQNIGAGDEIVVSLLEHHANIVPWQQLAAEKGAKIRVIPVDNSGQILLDEYHRLLNDRTKLVAVTQVSNALGSIVPVKAVIEAAHGVGAKVLVDGAQSVSHLRVNVQALDADFLAFSGHKLYGPTGIGVIYGKQALLDAMQPWQGGGNMIADVTFERTLYQKAPARFEAGTGNIADAVGLGAAIDYLERIGLENVAKYERDLLAYATRGLQTVPGLKIVGTAAEKTSVLSFVLDGYKPEEIGKALSHEGIAVRAGHHCAQPILRRFGLEATVRPSLAFYNTCREVDALIAVLHRLARG
jgi:cysteine desulfurase/selenocysteine lyase